MSITVVGFDSQERVAQTSVCVSIRRRRCFVTSQTKVCATWQKKSRSRLLSERLSGVLLGLTRGCDLRKEGVTVTTQDNNPNNRFDS
jgi:hypothetical protein